MQPVSSAFTIMLSMPGGLEWILIALVVLLMFGGKKIPELMRGIGKGIRAFKDEKATEKKEGDVDTKEHNLRDKTPTPPAS